MGVVELGLDRAVDGVLREERPTEAQTSPKVKAPLPTVASTEPVSVAEMLAATFAVTVLGDAGPAARMWLSTSLSMVFVELAPPPAKLKLVEPAQGRPRPRGEMAVAVGLRRRRELDGTRGRGSSRRRWWRAPYR